MTNNKKLYIKVTAFLVLAGVGALVFYFYKTRKSDYVLPPVGDNFIQSIAQSPAVEGNVVNSGIAGGIILGDGTPFEASLDVFKASDLSNPFISVRSDAGGRFQIPLKPDIYVIKPNDPDGPHAPIRSQYTVTIGNGQWLQVRIEYK